MLKFNSLALILNLLIISTPLCAAEKLTSPEKQTPLGHSKTLEVIDSYLEMHTGPGRGYLIFNVVEQGEYVELLSRRPDWYEVRSQGKIGWVKASQIARTLQITGEPVDLPSVSYGEYAKNRFRLGLIAGDLSGGNFKNAKSFNANIGYSPLSWLILEAEFGKFYDDDAHGTQLSANIVIEPLSQWRISPALVIGAGSTKIDAQPRIIDEGFESDKHRLGGLRINGYLGRNFIVRGEYRQIAVKTADGDEDFTSWNFGFTTFF